MPQAIRAGDWKLYLDEVKEVPGSSDGPVLVNLAEDPLERTNHSAKHPQKFRAMKELALEQLADIEADSLSLGGPASDRRPETKRGLWLK